MGRAGKLAGKGRDLVIVMNVRQSRRMRAAMAAAAVTLAALAPAARRCRDARAGQQGHDQARNDLDGGPAEETVRFGLGGADYEIDLSATNAARIRAQLALFIGSQGRPPGAARPGRTAAASCGILVGVCLCGTARAGAGSGRRLVSSPAVSAAEAGRAGPRPANGAAAAG
jgi:hypothetical protein